MIGRTLLAAALLSAAHAGAQTYKPTPVERCFTAGAVRIGSERGSPASPLLHELVEQIAEARAHCEQAVKDRPKEARLHANLARIRALAGDAPGALEAARTGAGLGSANGQVLLGVMIFELQKDHAAAREQFQRAAKQGSNPHARYNLGILLANGWGVERDPADAAASFLQAANGGDALAMQVVAQRYDKARAEQWLKKAAEAMVPEGPREPLRIAQAQVDGAALLAWYQAKARAGEPWAAAYMGALTEAGQWVKQDYAAAADWYRRAGEAGSVPAQWRLARFYNEGRGVPQDRTEARRWSQMWEVKRCEDHERAEAGANACDRFAADRYDPQRVSEGVDSFCMRHFAQRAIKACSAAVKDSPRTARYRTQLARALAHAGRHEEARREAAAGAAAGSTTSMILIGVMIQRGLGTDRNEADALAWYRKAAEAGDSRAVNLVTTNVYNGIGIAKDSPEANALMQAMQQRSLAAVTAAPSPAEQAEKGDPRQQFNLAAQLEQQKRYDEAIKWYTRAADQGFRPAELNLAQMYEKGIGVKQDTAEARKRYRRLSDLGDGEARYRAARLAAAHQDYAEALSLYNRLVRDDDWRALLDLGEMVEDGRGVPKDVRRAAELYERTAERSPWARAKLGILHLNGGENLPRDYEKARRWLQRAANDGNPAARNNLGLMHDRGLAGPIDPAAARELYHAALGGGSAQARGNLESLYAQGRGAPSGPAAVEWYRRGAEAEIVSAQVRLGRMYAKGEGVERNDQVAAQWLMRAAQQGHPEARKEAAELLYAMGNDLDAAALGHEGAAKRLAAKMAAAGQPGAAEELRRYLAAGQRRFPALPVWPDGIALDPGPDQSRTLVVRVGGVAVPQAAAMDAGMANVYDIIRWFPETDGKK